MSVPHRCPVCHGFGQREVWGLTHTPDWRRCDACCGTGIVWDRGSMQLIGCPGCGKPLTGGYTINGYCTPCYEATRREAERD